MFKNKITPEEKLLAVELYLDGKGSYRKIGEKFNVYPTTVSKWVRNYISLGADVFYSTENVKRTASEKQIAVEYYLSGKGSLSETCKKFGIKSQSILARWIKKYNSHESLESAQGRGGKRDMTNGRNTTLEERIAIVEEYISTGINFNQLAEKHKVSYQQVYNWVKKYEAGGIDALVDRRGRKKDFAEMTEEERLRAEIRLLKAEKREQQMEIDFLKKLKEVERRWR